MSSTSPQPEKKPLDLKIPENIEPSYVNLARITHTPSEMIFDFALMVPGQTDAEIKNRVLMSPLSAKLFYNALGENLSKYEAKFGEIKLPGGGTSLAEHLFRPPQK